MKRIPRETIVAILSILVILGSFSFNFCVFFMKGKLSDNAIALCILTNMNSFAGIVLGYYFISSVNREKPTNLTGTTQTQTTTTSNEQTGGT